MEYVTYDPNHVRQSRTYRSVEAAKQSCREGEVVYEKSNDGQLRNVYVHPVQG